VEKIIFLKPSNSGYIYKIKSTEYAEVCKRILSRMISEFLLENPEG
jgi:hypothetical protein